jgi:DNA-binding LacI/PurR family transcriptional regulator
MARQFHPMVVWGGHELGTDYCTVGSDNIRGGKLAVKHLIGLGRQRIAFLGDVNAPEFRLRQLGWREALKEARLPADADLLIPSSLSESGAYEAMSHYLQTGPKIDAVFAASDLLAVSALKALRDAKLSVPNDVAVIGFDDIQIAPLVHPALTTVRQDLVQGARIMVECLFKRMGGDPADSVTLAPELIVRESA